MSKKGNRKNNGKRKTENRKKSESVIRNNVVFEIDYDKLAEAIVNAEQIASGKKSYTSNFFALIITFTFRMVAGLGFLLDVALGVFSWRYIANGGLGEIGNVRTILLSGFLVMIILIILLLAILLWKAAKEIENERDKNFIVAVFSAIVSMAALVVALIALIK